MPQHDAGSTRPFAVRQAPAHQKPRRHRPRVVTAGGPALLAVCAGLTAAAYAQVLPAPVQNIAHSVFALPGTPGTSPATPALTSPGQGSSPAPTIGGSAPSSAASTPRPVTTAGVSLRLAAGKARVAADGRDAFTGHADRDGHPVHGAAVRLLEQLSTDIGEWQSATTGVTGEGGIVTLTVPRIPASATFRLAGTGGLSDVVSPAVTITVTPRVLIRQPGPGILTVTASPAAAGDTVVLLRLDNGTWVTAATSHLSAAHETWFTVRPGAAYRILLPATRLHAYALTARITAIKSAARAKA
jgi:hypothetical protein